MKCGNCGDNISMLAMGEVRDSIGMFFMVSFNSLAIVASLCVIVPMRASTCLFCVRFKAIHIEKHNNVTMFHFNNVITLSIYVEEQ